MSNTSPTAHRRGLALAATLLAAPAILFFAILTPLASPYPIGDDYDAALGYLNHLVQLPTSSLKLLYDLSAQHNEYKLWFVNTLIWLQYRCLGKMDFRVAGLCSNLLVIPVILVLWKLFLPTLTDTRTRMLLFFPAVCLWFQLNYVETVDWAVSAYQTLPILIAATCGILLLIRHTRSSFAASLLCIPAAIGSSGNGFLFAAVGALFLFRRRRYAELLMWSLVSAACVAVYAYHYVPVHEPSLPGTSLLLRLLARPAFLLVWLGSAAVFQAACVPLGIALCVFWSLPHARRFLRENPAIAYILLFILLSGCMVALGRAGYGIWSARTSRYRLYSDLLLTFTWFALADRLVASDQQAPHLALRSRAYLTAAAKTALFALGMDAYGWRYLVKRDALHKRAMATYQHPAPGHSAPNPVPREPENPAHNLWEDGVHLTLEESERLNIYHPPPA